MIETAATPEVTTVELRPRFEGSNICTWIGFKHVMYVVEEAVLHYFRERGMVPRQLFEEHGLCLEIVDSHARILHALHMDDLVRVEVRSKTNPGDREYTLAVQLFVERDGSTLKALTGKVKVVLRQDRSGVTAPQPLPELEPYVVAEINRSDEPFIPASATINGRGSDGMDDAIRQVVPADANAFVWKWHIPYFYCHFTERIQHSGYLRLMEEVVDLFLANRGISIRTLLDQRGWIPVVPVAQVEILREALMEETLYTIYTVEQVFKDVTYTSRMDCYVVRDGSLIHTATGTITHGYAQILNRRDWSLVNFDEQVLAALNGEVR
jgi:acyl-CoA thioesterase FadM